MFVPPSLLSLAELAKPSEAAPGRLEVALEPKRVKAENMSSLPHQQPDVNYNQVLKKVDFP